MFICKHSAFFPQKVLFCPVKEALAVDWSGEKAQAALKRTAPDYFLLQGETWRWSHQPGLCWAQCWSWVGSSVSSPQCYILNLSEWPAVNPEVPQHLLMLPLQNWSKPLFSWQEFWVFSCLRVELFAFYLLQWGLTEEPSLNLGRSFCLRLPYLPFIVPGFSLVEWAIFQGFDRKILVDLAPVPDSFNCLLLIFILECV